MEQLKDNSRKIASLLCLKHKALMLTEIKVLKHDPHAQLVYFERQCCQCVQDAYAMQRYPEDPNMEVLREDEFEQLLKPQ